MDTKKKRTKSTPDSTDLDNDSVKMAVSKRRRTDGCHTSSSQDIPCNVMSSASLSNDDGGEQERAFPFTEDTGPQSPLTNESKPIDYFNLFIDSSLLELIVRETNKYSEHLMNSREITKGSRMKTWKPVTPLEIKAFIAVLLEMCITRRPTIFSYWSENSRSIPWFSKMFSRDRFQLIYQCFHLVDNDDCLPPGHENHDPCVKFMPIVEHANRVFKLYYKPHKELTISESSVGSSCHWSIRPNRQQHRLGVKFWMLCDAVTKYCLSFSCYKGAKRKTDNAKSREIGFDIAMELLEQSRCLNKGHHVFVNNCFGSIALAEYLHSRKTYLTGTIKSNGKGVTGDIKTPAPNETKYARDGHVLLCGYRENKSAKSPVLFVTTHDSNDSVINQRNVNDKVKPLIVDRYNRYMGGVDKFDKTLYVHLDERRTVKYWKKVAFHVIARMVLNSYIFYKEVTKKKAMTRLDFTSSIISDIDREWMQTKKQRMVIDENRIFGLTKLPGRNLRQCVVCSTKDTGRKRSNLVCAQCKRGLHALCLHKHVCFKNNDPAKP